MNGYELGRKQSIPKSQQNIRRRPAHTFRVVDLEGVISVENFEDLVKSSKYFDSKPTALARTENGTVF